MATMSDKPKLHCVRCGDEMSRDKSGQDTRCMYCLRDVELIANAMRARPPLRVA